MGDQHRPDPTAAARKLGATIAAASEMIEASRRIPESLLSELHESRLLRMLLPRAVGGDEAAPASYFLAVEELARHDASVAWNVFVANSTAIIAAFLELAIARTIFRESASLIAWGPPNSSTAAAVTGGGYRVSGRWDFASGCRHATWMGAHCPIVEADGSLRLDRFGRAITRTLLFPARAAALIDNWNTIGLRGTASDSYTVSNLFVPETFSTTREEPGLRRERGPLYAFTMQGLYAVGVAGVALGVAGTMLDEFISLASRKTPRGLARLAESGIVQAGVARAKARLDAARAYLLETLASIYANADGDNPIEVADRARVRLACTNAIHGAIEVANFSYGAAGVDAIFVGSPFERRFRDIHTLSQQVQARIAHFEAVGKVLLGSPPEFFL